MGAAPLDLAELRLLRALKSGGGDMAFVALWNAEAGALWSVFRAMCDRDQDALGWMASFRVELSQRAPTFRLDEPLGPQVGRAVYAHAREAFGLGGPLPEAPLALDERTIRALPPATRLAYLVDLFFDWTPPEPTVAAAYRLLEPAGDTDARLNIHTLLLRNPPAEARILPDPLPDAAQATVPKPRRTGWIGLGLGLLVVLVVMTALGNPAPSPARRHEEALSARGGVMVESRPEQLQAALLREGVRASLLECPSLERAGLVLIGARAERDVVVLLYRDAKGRDWTLQHDEGRRFGGAPDAEGLSLGRDGSYAVGSWRTAATTWTLVAQVDEEEMRGTVHGILRDRRAPSAPEGTEGDPFVPKPAPSAVASPAP